MDSNPSDQGLISHIAEFRVKQINFSCKSNSLAVIVNFQILQGSLAT